MPFDSLPNSIKEEYSIVTSILPFGNLYPKVLKLKSPTNSFLFERLKIADIKIPEAEFALLHLK